MKCGRWWGVTKIKRHRFQNCHTRKQKEFPYFHIFHNNNKFFPADATFTKKKPIAWLHHYGTIMKTFTSLKDNKLNFFPYSANLNH